MMHTLFRNPPGLSIAALSVLGFIGAVLLLVSGILFQFCFPESGDLVASLVGSERFSAIVQVIF